MHTHCTDVLCLASQEVCKISADAGESKVTAGQLVQGVVKSIDKVRKVVYLSSDKDMVSKSVVRYAHVDLIELNFFGANVIFESSLFFELLCR